MNTLNGIIKFDEKIEKGGAFVLEGMGALKWWKRVFNCVCTLRFWIWYTKQGGKHGNDFLLTMGIGENRESV